MDTLTNRPALAQLDALIHKLDSIRNWVDPIAQAKALRALDRPARAALARAADEAVFLAANRLVGVKRMTHEEVGRALGVTRYRVANAIADYRAWIAEEASK